MLSKLYCLTALLMNVFGSLQVGEISIQVEGIPGLEEGKWIYRPDRISALDLQPTVTTRPAAADQEPQIADHQQPTSYAQSATAFHTGTRRHCSTVGCRALSSRKGKCVKHAGNLRANNRVRLTRVMAFDEFSNRVTETTDSERCMMDHDSGFEMPARKRAKHSGVCECISEATEPRIADTAGAADLLGLLSLD